MGWVVPDPPTESMFGEAECEGGRETARAGGYPKLAKERKDCSILNHIEPGMGVWEVGSNGEWR